MKRRSILQDAILSARQKSNRSTRKILLYAIGTTGDVFPVICFARALVTAGYQVHMFTLQKWRKRCQEEGIHLLLDDAPCMNTEEGFDPAFAEEIVKLGGTLKGIRILLKAFDPVTDHLIKTAGICKNYDFVFLSSGALLLSDTLSHYKVRFGFLFLQPWIQTGEYGCPFTSLEYVPSEKPLAKNRFTWTVYNWLITSLFLQKMQNQRKALGLRKNKLPQSLTFLYDLASSIWRSKERSRTVPIITMFSSQLLPVPKDLSGAIKSNLFTLQAGPFVLHHSLCGQDFIPDNELLKFLQSGEKPVFFGYGSLQLVGQDISEKQETQIEIWCECMQQLQQERAIFTVNLKKKSRDEIIGALSEHSKQLISSGRIHLLSGSIPHTWLFPRCKLVVHHGGAGTSQTTAMCGVPSVVVPHIADQHFMASVLKYKGLTTDSIPITQVNAERLLKALKTIIEDTKYFENAAKIAEQIERDDPIEKGVKLVDAFLGTDF